MRKFVFGTIAISVAAMTGCMESEKPVAETPKVKHIQPFDSSVKSLIAAEPRLAQIYVHFKKDDKALRMASAVLEQDAIESAYYINMSLAGDESGMVKKDDKYIIRDKWQLDFEPGSWIDKQAPQGRLYLPGEWILSPKCEENKSPTLLYSELVPLNGEMLGLELKQENAGFRVKHPQGIKTGELFKYRMLVDFGCAEGKSS